MKLLRLLKCVFVCIALLFSVSVGYSKLQQELSIISTATIEPQQYEDDYYSNFHVTKWWPWIRLLPPAMLWYYHYDPITLTYIGNNPSITSWDVTIATPSDAQMISNDFENCQYSYNSGTLKIYNTINNGSISPGGSVTFDIAFVTNNSNYQLNITNSNFYSQSNPNPNLTAIAGQPTLTRGTGSGTPGNYTYPYTLALRNQSNYDFQDWEVILPFDQGTMQIKDNVNFNYVIRDGKLILFGYGIAKNSTRNTSFKITYSSTPIPPLTVTSFIGKALILN